MIPLSDLPLVGTLADTARVVADRTVATAVFAISVPGRVEALLDTAENLVQRVDAVVADAAAAVAHATEVIASTTEVVENAAEVAAHAQVVVASASRTSDTAGELLDTYAPMAKQAAPLAGQFIDEMSPEEVHAAIVLLDQFPMMADRTKALMPILGTLEAVAPEIHELLGVAKDVRQAIVGVPGFDFLRRRGEGKEGEGKEND
ncbi:ribulose 1,5-bisphosphate carboxylase large subunit [Rhodococcus chondri]|uniref:Ribulose 1,5-bisphosphate carboxylase large subunit n=1 Tax=Rhodococcus chondri TaxID=3065941 RepID=A0ABU7JPY7_9NOCA|nr:ribulose 1,5-bisphosphate carboxylase large subunit [Rhodococcus sp. CC-R104]MEE2032085.1 ribulose 1,5-bisphosphate carboxylase large subunit [Rhodococcus sp. CC-R104]